MIQFITMQKVRRLACQATIASQRNVRLLKVFSPLFFKNTNFTRKKKGSYGLNFNVRSKKYLNRVFSFLMRTLKTIVETLEEINHHRKLQQSLSDVDFCLESR